jgi:hypothetical protein
VAAALVALGAATAYALASVLQQRAAAAVPARLSMRAGLLVRLAARPLWLAGIGADVAGYVLQFIALGLGSLAVVQPLLVAGLLIALPLSARFAHTTLDIDEWVAAICVVTGLAVFLIVAHPADGTADTSGRTWALVSIVTVVPALALIGLGLRTDGAGRARRLAAATGLLYGETAALTKTSAHLLSGGVAHLVTAWPPYALVALGAVGMLTAQSAFQAAPLDASLPVLTVVDPLASVAIGALAFHEALANGPAAVAVEGGALVLLTVGVFRLGRTLAAVSA